MPPINLIDTKLKKRLRPKASEIFTDREHERKVINEFALALAEAAGTLKPKVLTFYGVGGVGKSSLLGYATQRIFPLHTGFDALRVALCDLDSSNYDPSTGIMPFYGQVLMKALQKAGLRLKAFEAFYLVWWARANPDQEITREQFLSRVLGGAEKGSDFLRDLFAEDGLGSAFADIVSTTRAGVMVGKLTQWISDNKNKKLFDESFQELDLATMSLLDFEKHACDVIYVDLMNTIGENQKSSLLLILDGFERIQSSQRLDDLQHSLSRLLGNIVTSSRQLKFGCIIFGREKLRWRDLYDSRSETNHWDLFLEQHYVEGLSSKDAKNFIESVCGWYEAINDDRNKRILDLIQQYSEKILLQAEEDDNSSGQVSYLPYSLDLAIQQVVDHNESFKEEMLGKGASDLEDRFLRYMDPSRKRSLELLNVTLSFTEGHFEDLLSAQMVSGLKGTTFPELVENASYVFSDQVNPLVFRFHRHMQRALKSSISRSPNAETLICDVLDIYITNQVEPMFRSAQVGDDQIERAYDQISNTLKEWFDLGVLSFSSWEQRFWKIQQSSSAFLNLKVREQRLLEALDIVDRASNTSTLAKYLNELATVLKESGNFKAASTTYFSALEAAESSDLANTSLIAKIEHNLAISYKEDHQFSKAEKHIQRAIFLQSRPTGSESDLALCYLTQGSLLNRQRELSSIRAAVEIGTKAVAILRNLGDSDRLRFALDFLGGCYRKMGDRASLERSSTLLHESYELTLKLRGNNHPDTAHSLGEIAITLSKQGEQGCLIAQRYLEEAISIMDYCGFDDTYAYKARLIEKLDYVDSYIKNLAQ